MKVLKSSHKNSNSKKIKSIFHHFCPGRPVSLTICPIKQCGTLSYVVNQLGRYAGVVDHLAL